MGKQLRKLRKRSPQPQSPVSARAELLIEMLDGEDMAGTPGALLRSLAQSGKLSRLVTVKQRRETGDCFDATVALCRDLAVAGHDGGWRWCSGAVRAGRDVITHCWMEYGGWAIDVSTPTIGRPGVCVGRLGGFRRLVQEVFASAACEDPSALQAAWAVTPQIARRWRVRRTASPAR